MSGLAMGPAEPPADDVLELTDRLTAARIYRDDAAHTLALLRGQLADEQPTGERLTYLGIEVGLGERRLLAWGLHIEQLAARARALGIRP